MKNVRTAGVLLHITSLNSTFGIGVMGREAFSFAEKLQRMSFRYWQVLPLVPVDGSGSPYCSVSAFAGNISLIDPRPLMEEGLLTSDEIKENEFEGTIYKTQYRVSLEKRRKALKKAFSRINDDTRALIEIFKEQNEWVSSYAYFMALKEYHGEKPWWQWEEKYKDYKTALTYENEHKEAVDFHIFTQYIFFTQWRRLKEYANSKGVYLIGDMPVYVSRDSADVWSNVSLFEFDEKSLQPKEVAGVPPDYFSEDGQLWGIPLYNWSVME